MKSKEYVLIQNNNRRVNGKGVLLVQVVMVCPFWVRLAYVRNFYQYQKFYLAAQKKCLPNQENLFIPFAALWPVWIPG